MKTVLSKASRADVQSSPFPYILIENAIDEDLCDALIKEFPNNNVVAQGRDLGDNLRFSLSAPLVEKSPEISPLWKEFIALHSSQEFFDQFLNLFESHIKKVYPDLLDKKIKTGVRNKDEFDTADVLVDAQICINSPVINKPSSVKIGHIDASDKIYAGLFYLRHPDDDTEGGNLEIYRAKNGNYKIHNARLVLEKYTERVLTVPYKKNTLILFLNTPDSLHGVTERSITLHTRKFMNLVAETPHALFDIEKYRENIVEKIIRKMTS